MKIQRRLNHQKVEFKSLYIHRKQIKRTKPFSFKPALSNFVKQILMNKPLRQTKQIHSCFKFRYGSVKTL